MFSSNGSRKWKFNIKLKYSNTGVCCSFPAWHSALEVLGGLWLQQRLRLYAYKNRKLNNAQGYSLREWPELSKTITQKTTAIIRIIVKSGIPNCTTLSGEFPTMYHLRFATVFNASECVPARCISCRLFLHIDSKYRRCSHRVEGLCKSRNDRLLTSCWFAAFHDR